MSDFYVADICTSDPCSFFRILKSMSFFNSQIGVQFSNRRHMTSLTYTLALTLTIALTNKSPIHLRIWKGRQFENTLNWTMIRDNDVSGCRFMSKYIISVCIAVEDQFCSIMLLFTSAIVVFVL